MAHLEYESHLGFLLQFAAHSLLSVYSYMYVRETFDVNQSMVMGMLVELSFY